VSEGERENHIREHNILLADMRLVEADCGQSAYSGYIEHIMVLESIDCLLKHHPEGISPRIFQELF
jgi:hypothetical protein